MDEKQEPPKIIFRHVPVEQHRIGEGDITLTYVQDESPVIHIATKRPTMVLSMDQAMELSIILEIWTREYAHPQHEKPKKVKKGKPS